ncbi:hypothetical protein PYW07_006984 [Mythimna separata]|uniref:Uncharacterized protein n=1 Tax=Mythimna separata TaxID=271217 RepID=A0AAD7YZR1_MYTSE|nr:hypothetical protein PYW07_006984 [Mythimna separata]
MKKGCCMCVHVFVHECGNVFVVVRSVARDCYFRAVSRNHVYECVDDENVDDDLDHDCDGLGYDYDSPGYNFDGPGCVCDGPGFDCDDPGCVTRVSNDHSSERDDHYDLDGDDHGYESDDHNDHDDDDRHYSSCGHVLDASDSHADVDRVCVRAEARVASDQCNAFEYLGSGYVLCKWTEALVPDNPRRIF